MNILFSKSYSCGHPEGVLDWYTWSPIFREKLYLVASDLANISLSVERINDDEKYGYSYIALGKETIGNRLKNIIDEACNELYKINHQQRAFLLTDLIFSDFDSVCLKNFIALVSERYRQHIPSFHSPIKQSKTGLGFPLHADLFGPRALINVMTDVYPNTGGDILLVKREDLLKALRSIDAFDDKAIPQVDSILKNRHKFDLFDRLYNFLYGDDIVAKKLQGELDKYTINIPNKNGTGYFIEDGEWLHGRNNVNVSVSEDRIQRLVFDTEKTLNISTLSVNSSNRLLSSFEKNSCNFDLFEVMKSKSYFQSQKSIADSSSKVA